MSSLSEAKNAASVLKGDLEHLTVDLSQAVIVRQNSGVKVGHSKEDAKAILADATDYYPEGKTTFMSAFDSLFTRSYPYVEKLAGSFRLPLGDLQNMWPEGEGPTVGSSAANAQ
ncbi:hypothetical protein Tco_0482423 [Tanacetum coccineum]